MNDALRVRNFQMLVFKQIRIFLDNYEYILSKHWILDFQETDFKNQLFLGKIQPCNIKAKFNYLKNWFIEFFLQTQLPAFWTKKWKLLIFPAVKNFLSSILFTSKICSPTCQKSGTTFLEVIFRSAELWLTVVVIWHLIKMNKQKNS